MGRDPCDQDHCDDRVADEQGYDGTNPRPHDQDGPDSVEWSEHLVSN